MKIDTQFPKTFFKIAFAYMLCDWIIGDHYQEIKVGLLNVFRTIYHLFN
jgi:hypothetical protein